MRVVELEFENEADYEKAFKMAIAIEQANPASARRAAPFIIAKCGGHADALLEKLAAEKIPAEIKRDEQFPAQQFGYDQEW